MVGLPKLPSPDEALSLIDKATGTIDKGLGLIDKVVNKIDSSAMNLGHTKTKPAESPSILEEVPITVSKGTACLPCSRDHLSTTSSALSEAVRFARDGGVRHPEVLKRIRIAIDELNIMERIDLAPSEIARLGGKEKELANWVLATSRGLRHAITDIKDADSVEQAAAKASEATEGFMKRLWDIPEEECETCGEIVEKLRDYIEKKKREGGEQV